MSRVKTSHWLRGLSPSTHFSLCQVIATSLNATYKASNLESSFRLSSAATILTDVSTGWSMTSGGYMVKSGQNAARLSLYGLSGLYVAELSVEVCLLLFTSISLMVFGRVASVCFVNFGLEKGVSTTLLVV